jgi:hypothetical protein
MELVHLCSVKVFIKQQCIKQQCIISLSKSLSYFWLVCNMQSQAYVQTYLAELFCIKFYFTFPTVLQWPTKKKDPKGRRGQEFQVHTYPTFFSRPRGRRVQSLVQIISEMWICISSIHTHKQTFIFIYKINTVTSIHYAYQQWYNVQQQ